MPSAPTWNDLHVYTIGHSTRSLEAFLEGLTTFDIDSLIDVRTIPRSRRHPQFAREALASSLRDEGIEYHHLPALGGLRHARKDSSNVGWRNASFRGYADHMQTDAFEDGLSQLHGFASDHNVAIMCAEAVPWRCHRSLIADAITASGGQVEHITAAWRSRPHRMTPFARVDAGRVSYPADR
jgi:uncharacterized protein (DUF488 family)